MIGSRMRRLVTSHDAHGDRHRTHDIGDEEDPDRCVDRYREANERLQQRHREDRPGQAERQDREIVEYLATAKPRAHIDVRDRRTEQHRDRRGRDREPEAVHDAARRNLIVDQRSVEVGEREVVERERIRPHLAEGGDHEHRQRRDRARDQHDQDDERERPTQRAERVARCSRAAPAHGDERAAADVATLHDEADHRHEHEHDPRNACGPNNAIELIAASSAPPVIAGATSGSVMRRSIVHRRAPSIRADSSSDGSTDCSAP